MDMPTSENGLLNMLTTPPPPPPPPPGAGHAVPPPPPPPKAAPAATASSASSSGSSVSSNTMALLDQIRGGLQLKKIDVEKLRRQSMDRRAASRKSVVMVKSLEETIRAALQTKFAFDEEPEESDDW
eukprot:TRINITY_DN3485_c1_g1_i1.p1 TRINITY_DN3485_c1_g1~~TRINITY_DN3485_c1_g1_i1.p1  ORF type:complete len:127 (-),score=21.79 TRINITY_DN3485_c1_g1_i1:61-441(-)